MGNERFKVGGRVRLPPEAVDPAGHILGLLPNDSAYKGHIRRARPDELQYGMRSGKSDHVAMGKRSAWIKFG